MRTGKSLAITLSFTLTLTSAHADPSQLRYQVDAAELHDRASDLSMESATGHAMVAVVNLAAMNIGGAVSNGYAAYGNYRNSEGLDTATDRNIRAAHSYESLSGTGAGTAKFEVAHKTTAAAPEAEEKTGAKRTTFRRLNRKFLREGKMNEIAAEFEAKSGMSRDQFFDALATISEQKISAKDPEVVEKAIGRFRAFIELVPNPEFKAGLAKALDSVPDTVQKGFVAQAISKAINFVADGNVPKIEPVAPVAAAETPRAPASLDEPALLVAANTPAPPPVVRDEKIGSAAPLLYESDAKDSDELLALAAEEDRTIFAMVSKRYRQLSPGLVAASVVKNSVN